MIENFVAFDFETSKGKNACSIGIVEFRGGKIVDSFYSLIKPMELDFNPMATRIHGIRVEDVIYEKEFNEIWQELQHFFDNKIIVAHNYSYDLSVLNFLLNTYKIEKPNFEILCTLKLSRKYLQIVNHKLSTVASHFQIEQNSYHNALEDALVCGKAFIQFFQYAKDAKEIKKIGGVKSKSSGQSKSYPWMRKETVTRDSSFEIKVLSKKSNKLKEMKFVISGVFTKFYRNELKKSIEDNGGKVSSSISKKTNYIIAGDNMGPSKRSKAEELGIPIISEDDYIAMI